MFFDYLKKKVPDQFCKNLWTNAICTVFHKYETGKPTMISFQNMHSEFL
jgi:hypothetical protein